jgi:hypothetical protein
LRTFAVHPITRKLTAKSAKVDRKGAQREDTSFWNVAATVPESKRYQKLSGFR